MDERDRVLMTPLLVGWIPAVFATLGSVVGFVDWKVYPGLCIKWCFWPDSSRVIVWREECRYGYGTGRYES